MKILGLSEVRWKGSREIRLQNQQSIIYSGNTAEGSKHEKGVAIVLANEGRNSLIGWKATTKRIMWTRLKARYYNIIIINVYASTNEHTEEDKEQFYEQLQTTYEKINYKFKKDVKIIIGDLNAKIGSENEGHEKVMGREGIGTRNDNGNRLIEFCECNEFTIGGSTFKHKTIHKETWRSPGGKFKNQIDHILINSKYRSWLQDVRSQRGADVGSDHMLVRAKMKMKLLNGKNKK